MLCFSVCVCLCECLLCFVVAMAEEDLESAAVQRRERLRALRAAVELVENKAEGEEKEEDGQEDDDEEEEHSQ